MEAFGWVSSFCFAVCSIPQAWYAYRIKDASYMPWATLILWGIGEVCGTIYALYIQDAPILTNMLVNAVCCVIMIKYKIVGEQNKNVLLSR